MHDLLHLLALQMPNQRTIKKTCCTLENIQLKVGEMNLKKRLNKMIENWRMRKKNTHLITRKQDSPLGLTCRFEIICQLCCNLLTHNLARVLPLFLYAIGVTGFPSQCKPFTYHLKARVG